MEIVKVQWNTLVGSWLVSPINGQQSQTLEQWAQGLADLTQVKMVLSATNYAVHWLSLPGVSSRHLNKVLPFALEESLIEEINNYLIVPAGQVNKRYRAYVVANDLIERLLENCQLHHIVLTELIPETWLLNTDNKTNLIVREEYGYFISFPGQFEGFVAETALTPTLESIFSKEVSIERLQLKSRSVDPLQLLETTLETSFPGQILHIDKQLLDESTPEISSKAFNLLVGQFQTQSQEDKPKAWWRPLVAMAATLLVIWTVMLYTEVNTLKSQSNQVQQQSIALYKQLFPGERIRALERQFREKLSGESSVDSVGFLNSTNKLAMAYHQQNLEKNINLSSMRFNDRLQELTIEVHAANLDELQKLRQALENAGIQAEIATATNDKDGVKGRLRIGGQS